MRHDDYTTAIERFLDDRGITDYAFERRQILETAKADAANLLTKAKDDAHLIFRDAERKRDIMLAEARSKADDIEAKLANVHKVLAAAR